MSHALLGSIVRLVCDLTTNPDTNSIKRMGPVGTSG